MRFQCWTPSLLKYWMMCVGPRKADGLLMFLRHTADEQVVQETTNQQTPRKHVLLQQLERQ